MKILIMYTFLFFSFYITSYAQTFITKMPDCSSVSFYEDNVTIGSCKLEVYRAVTDVQKICGMLNFTYDTFRKDGMIFDSDNSKSSTHYFHTENMQIDIRIMGLIKIDNNSYKIYNNDVKYSPPGIKSITIYGNAVFETTEKKYQDYLSKCLLDME